MATEEGALYVLIDAAGIVFEVFKDEELTLCWAMLLDLRVPVFQVQFADPPFA